MVAAIAAVMPALTYSALFNLVNLKILGFKIAVIPSILSGETEYAVIRISYTLRIIQLIAILPDALLGCAVTQDFHGAPKHNTSVDSVYRKNTHRLSDF